MDGHGYEKAAAGVEIDVDGEGGVAYVAARMRRADGADEMCTGECDRVTQSVTLAEPLPAAEPVPTAPPPRLIQDFIQEIARHRASPNDISRTQKPQIPARWH